MDPLKMYFLLNMGIFHGYVSLPEGRFFEIIFNTSCFQFSRNARHAGSGKQGKVWLRSGKHKRYAPGGGCWETDGHQFSADYYAPCFFFNFPGNFFPEFRKSLHNMRIATCSKLQRKGLLDISWFAFKEVQVYLCAGIRKAWPANVSFVRFCRRAWRWVLQAVDRIYIRLHWWHSCNSGSNVLRVRVWLVPEMSNRDIWVLRGIIPAPIASGTTGTPDHACSACRWRCKTLLVLQGA